MRARISWMAASSSPARAAAEVPPSSSGLRGLEGRLKRALEIVGAFPLGLHDQIQLSANLFDADSVGFHTYTGKRFSGWGEQAGGVAGVSKVLTRASAEMVVEDHWITNAQGVAATMSIRYLGPTYVDSGYAYVLAQTYWLENTVGLAETAGPLTAVSADANVHGPAIWHGVLNAFTTLHLRLPVHLLPGARLSYTADTLDIDMSATWHGYVI